VDGIEILGETELSYPVTFAQVDGYGVGQHTITFRAEDKDGGWDEATTSVFAYTSSPFITLDPSDSSYVVTGTSLALEARADNRRQAEPDPSDYSSSEAGMSYSWSKTDGPEGVTFSANDSHAAGTTVVQFSLPGEYTFSVTVRNKAGLPTTVDDIHVTVEEVQTAIVIDPPVQGFAWVIPPENPPYLFGYVDFSAYVLDQFGNVIDDPGTIVWAYDVNQTDGYLDAETGEYQFGEYEGTDQISATCGNFSATAEILVQHGNAIQWTEGSASGQEGLEREFLAPRCLVWVAPSGPACLPP